MAVDVLLKMGFQCLEQRFPVCLCERFTFAIVFMVRDESGQIAADERQNGSENEIDPGQ